MSIRSIIFVVIGVVATALLGASGAFIFFNHYDRTVPDVSIPLKEVAPINVIATSTNVSVFDQYESWKTHTNDTYNFSLRYPPNWTFVEDLDGTTGLAGGGFVKFYPSEYGSPDKYIPEFIRVRLEDRGPNTLAAKYGIESLQELRQRDIFAGLEGKHLEYQDYIKANYSGIIEDLGGFKTLVISLGPKYGIYEMDFTMEESTYIVFDNYQTSDSLSQERALHEKILRSLRQL